MVHLVSPVFHWTVHLELRRKLEFVVGLGGSSLGSCLELIRSLILSIRWSRWLMWFPTCFARVAGGNMLYGFVRCLVSCCDFAVFVEF